MLAVCWLVWAERNNRIFSQKSRTSSILFDTIIVNLPKKQWRTFVRARFKGVAGRIAVQQQMTSTSIDDGEVVDVVMQNIDASQSNTQEESNFFVDAQPLRVLTAEGVEAITVD